jgi:DNA-binding transcriptional regulator YbjK
MPAPNARADTIEAALRVCEYGFEHLSYTNVGAQMGVTANAVCYYWKDAGGTLALRAAVVELAIARGNPFILGQLRAMRALPSDDRA